MGKPSRIHPKRLLAIVCFSAGALAQPPPLATTVPLILPSGLAYDAGSNLYFAETANHAIRRVSATGTLTTVAGTGTQGFAGDGGLATAAALDSPTAVAFDAAGDLYLADAHNHRIRRVDAATGVIATVAIAGLDLPTALAFNGAGDLFVADARTHRVLRVDHATGAVTTAAGNGTQGFAGDGGLATAAALDSPTGIAVDRAGNLYLADTHNHRVRRVDAATGLIASVAGTGQPGFGGDGGAASSAAVDLPRGLAMDASGNLFLVDARNNRVRRIDAATGQMTTIAGQGTEAFLGDGGAAVGAALDTPRAVTVSPGNLPTVADAGNNRVRQVDSAAVIHTIAGLGVSTAATLSLTGSATTVYGTGAVVATLASTPASGSVSFFDGGNGVGNASLVSNAATFATTTLAAGQHTLTATYPGDVTHQAAQSGALAVSIAKAAASVSLSNALAVHVATTTAGQPQGSVALLDANAVFATGTLSASGDAQFSSAGLSNGSHTLTAAYAGDADFLGATSGPQIVTIGPAPSADFAVAVVGSPAVTVGAGSAAQFSFAVSPVNGALSSPILLTVSGLPAGATASFNPAYLPPSSSTAGFVLTIQTLKTAGLLRGGLAVWAAMVPLVWVARRRRRVLLLGLVCVGLGCGDRVNTGAGSVAPRTYNVTVTGTATSSTGATLQHTVGVTLTVQ